MMTIGSVFGLFGAKFTFTWTTLFLPLGSLCGQRNVKETRLKEATLFLLKETGEVPVT